ncbi:MAG TPA: radical SAM protein [Thermoanaerobaculia bacterium]|nr:radical SAM protein [Thermoanaerobaculia bacterium]
MKRRPAPFSKPALLCVVPPYTVGPPAGLAYLLAYAKRQGCSDFGFLDLRLGVPDAYAPTYAHTGVFGESYVMDVPDLPLVLALLRAVDAGEEPVSGFPAVLEAYCRERGISASYLGDYLRCLDRYFAAMVERLADVRFVGCTIWTSNFLTSLLFAAHLKRLPRPPFVVGGGPQVTESQASAALALRSRLFDCIIPGEGEASLLAVYSRVEAGGGPASDPLPGTLFLDGDRVQRAPDRPLLRHDEIPVPAFEQMPLVAYHRYGASRSVPYHLSRGCTDKCTFCSEWVFWRRFRMSETAATLDGVRQLQAEYGAEHIAFTDSLLNGHPGRLRELAEGMLRLRPRPAWGGFMRAQMEPETAKLLRRAGCEVVFIGIESMSDETLALMNKRRTELQNITALRAFLGAGIEVVAGLIPGFPGDSREAFLYTVDLLRSIQQEYPRQLRVNVEPFIVSPGQPLYKRLGEVGLQGMPWSGETLDIAPRYRDVTEALFSVVVGANQGVERVGRLRVAEAVETDEPTRTDPFYYRVSEPLNRSEFTFDHLTGGWSLARIKGSSAWMYALIVEEREREELETRSAQGERLDLPSGAGLRHFCRRLEAAHLVRPQTVPEASEGGYDPAAGDGTRYGVAPTLVARYGDWHLRSRLLVADFVHVKWHLLPPWQGEALRVLRRPQTAASLQARLALRGIERRLPACVQLIDDLLERGVVVAVGPRLPARQSGAHEPAFGGRGAAA